MALSKNPIIFGKLVLFLKYRNLFALRCSDTGESLCISFELNLRIAEICLASVLNILDNLLPQQVNNNVAPHKYLLLGESSH